MLENYSFIHITDDMPRAADICFIMDNDSMEPLIEKGSRVCVSRLQSPEEMEVGLFYYKGRVLCRQFCEDYAGNMLLLCANPRCEGETLCLDKKEKQRCRCLGRVLLKEKPPAPVYV